MNKKKIKISLYIKQTNLSFYFLCYYYVYRSGALGEVWFNFYELDIRLKKLNYFFFVLFGLIARVFIFLLNFFHLLN